MEEPKKVGLITVLAVSVAGSALEWYDFSVFGFFAKEIGKNFFPSKDPAFHVIQAFGLYAGGFVVRPLGSILFGAIGDRWGSGRALQASIVAMALPTTLIGVLPVYAKVGILAPALLTGFRLLQGVMAGGEIIGAVIYTTENTSAKHRGLFGGLVLGMALLGFFLGSAVATTVHHFMSKEEVLRFGWRIPFLCGLAVAAVGFFVRSSQYARDAQRAQGHGRIVSQQYGGSSLAIVGSVFHGHLHEVIQGACAASLYHAGFYISCVWLGTYLASLAPRTIAPDVAFGINSVGLALHILQLPLFGMLADRYGRALVMSVGALLTAVAAPPCFVLLSNGTIAHRFIGAVILTSCLAVNGGPLFSWLIANSSAVARYTAVGLAYNLAAAVFGGTGPLVASALTESNIVVAPGLYLSAVAVLTLVTLVASHVFIGEKEQLRAQKLEQQQQRSDGVEVTTISYTTKRTSPSTLPEGETKSCDVAIDRL